MSFPFVQPYFGLGNSLQTAQASGGGAGGIGGWVELARTTLGSSNATIDVSSIPDKRYYQIVWHTSHTGSWNQPGLRLGNGTIDTGSNYAERYNFDGGSDSTNSPNTYHVQWANAAGPNTPLFGCMYISNLSSKEKLGITHVADQNTAGSGTAPRRSQTVFKWVNTSNVLDRLEFNNKGSGTFNSGSEIVVLGWDPADTHTTNFWEELASVEWSSGGTIDTGAFTAKKYLCVQVQFKGNSGVYTRFNSDSGSNYAWRYSNNGLADATQTSITGIHANFGFDTNPHFVNMFINNNASNEKLVISDLVTQNTAGAGNVSSRQEAVHKWANTSSQITSMQLVAGSGNFTGGLIKVWGAD